MTRPFRFAVQATRPGSGAEWHETARRIEELGYSTLFLADHYLGKGPAAKEARYPPQHLAPITAMAVAAAVTTTLRIGCRVFCADYHVPGVLMKEATTLDRLSDGRLEFGIGGGWSEPEYRAMGIPFTPGAQRISKLEEVVALFKAHCSGEQLDIAGDYVTARDYAGLPLPVQRPHPPIMIGGSRRRVLSLAGREADIASISNVPFDPVDAAGRTPQQEAARRLGFVRDAAGDRFGDIDIESSPFFTAVTADPAAALSGIATVLRISADGLGDHPNVLTGTVDEIADRLLERREIYGANYITVQQTEFAAFAPVVELLTGK
ncbi:TIGR03621 family F420-dependent LLM class oxidoreductase [Nocardia sp. alder85J]|uniref:TIGR03621 family F420-dependent LLM class oxidoreductase n=1 Tax=Nocardia sp. alder85J TaxID=2862949 RepID=UPI001CD4C9BD|nr:TIGR03621 family F420-dependent LLM class oxidoreductase [Nocardia sp. alder85J]MCX4090812.1 TIGR03621 family F420-dependent LLM class oxidoreductase [Nocardia sp. alder85J]